MREREKSGETRASDAGLSAGGEAPRIALEGLTKGFAGKEVLRGIDLEVRHGESLVILGASGSGKSVLLRHVIGLLEPDEGRVLIDGEDMSNAGERGWKRVRRRVGMAFQEGALFDSMNVFDNVAFPLRRQRWGSEREIAARVSECLRTVELDESVETKQVSELSGGMRRRVGFARAIALAPEILLFDEPQTGLDPLTAANIDQDIRRFADDPRVTLVTITHDMRSAMRIASRIAMLRAGRIVADAEPEAFQRLEDPYIQAFLAGEPPEEEDER